MAKRTSREGRAGEGGVLRDKGIWGEEGRELSSVSATRVSPGALYQ